jgi:hypothetical protein
VPFGALETKQKKREEKRLQKRKDFTVEVGRALLRTENKG